jgi:hypothetical protein
VEAPRNWREAVVERQTFGRRLPPYAIAALHGKAWTAALILGDLGVFVEGKNLFQSDFED